MRPTTPARRPLWRSLARPTTGSRAPATISDAEVRAAVGRLPAPQRDVLFLRFYLNYDYLTIAETLGIEVGTVSATLHAAREKLAQALEEVAR